MRTILLAALLLAAPLALAPTAAAQPCEVPGCQIVGAAACIAERADELPKGLKQVVRDCTTGTA